MPVISVINSKGGVGKTTISLNLGLFLGSQQINTIFVDLDPQHSLSDWIKRRPQSLSQHKCIKATVSKLFKGNLLSESNQQSCFILDCPARLNQQEISELLEISDILLVPITPTPVDLTALSHFFFQLAANYQYKIEDKLIALIANRAKTFTRSHSQTLSKIDKFKVPLIATLRDTQNYTLPSSNGMGILDLPPYHTQQDIESWNTIVQWVKQNLKESDLFFLSEEE